MTDIYDIKANILWFPIDIFYSFLYIIFFIVIFLLLKYMLNKKTLWEDNNKLNEVLNEKIDYLKLLLEIDPNIKKEEFYSKISLILRDFLEEKLQKPISKMTFKEIKDLLLEKHTEDLVASIYFSEFKKEIDDSSQFREKILDEVKALLSK